MTDAISKITDLVHRPVLTLGGNDLHAQDQALGIIICLHPTDLLVGIHFGRGDIKEFSLQHVLILKDEAVLYDYVLNHVLTLQTLEFKLLMQINLLQQNRQIASAIELVMDNPFLREHAMISLDELIGIDIEQHINKICNDLAEPSIEVAYA